MSRSEAPIPVQASRPRLLIVDDEPGIVDFLALGLGYEGFETQSARDGETGLRMALADPPDLIILDLMLPCVDGFELCRRLRKVSGVPVIMLTARDEVDDRVQGLDLGADDYLTKPFQFKELVARIRAVLRRRGHISPGEGPALEGGRPPRAEVTLPLQVGDVTLNPSLHEVWRGGRFIPLTLREFDLLKLLLSYPNQVLPRDAILDRVWGYDFMGDDNIIEVYVRYLRQKLGPPNLIQTVRGVGYIIKYQPPEATANADHD
jgi:two-component system, OmpR family, response regulator MprA